MVEITIDGLRFQFEGIPEPIGLFKSLKKLNVGGIYISQLPVFLKGMDQLEELILFETLCGLTKQSIEILRSMKNLKKLVLGLNEYSSLPEELFELTNLTELDLSFNYGLSTISESIGKLINLEKLEIANCELIKIPESIGKLKKLKYLDLNRNNYWILDDEWSEDVEYIIPASIGNLENLEVLDLSGSGNRQFLGKMILPDSIGKLRNLKKLNLSNNYLTYLPDSFDHLLNLEELYLDKNNFDKVPDCLVKLEKNGKLRIIWYPKP